MWRPSGRWRVPWLASVSRRSSRRTWMTDELITLELEDGLAILTLDYPPLNLVDAVTWDALDARTAELVADPPRAVLIRATGRVVSAGVDVQFFADMDPEDTVAFWRHALEIVERIETLPCPVVFAVHALTLNAAFEIALACDIIVGARSAQLGSTGNVVELCPWGGGPARVCARVSVDR